MGTYLVCSRISFIRYLIFQSCILVFVVFLDWNFLPYFFTSYLSLTLCTTPNTCLPTIQTNPVPFSLCLHKPLANYFSNIGFLNSCICLLYLTVSALKAGIFSGEFWLSQGLVWCSGFIACHKKK